MAAFALYGLIAAMIGSKYPKWGLLCAVFAIATGISRVFLVQHFLIDILAGATLGLAVCWLVLRINRSAAFQNARWLDGRPGRSNGTSETV
jgi:membrane-associated phospholipid phosphatase